MGHIERRWESFKKRNGLSDEQLSLFQQYAELLVEWNEKFNLTALLSLKDIISYHFEDSLVLGKFTDLKGGKTIADVGSGAGFPAIPLKIIYPSLGVILIETNRKKQMFLKEVIKLLGLSDIEVCDIDFRTFLRKTEGDIDFFVARASLYPKELVRMFSPICPYRDAMLIYWASSDFMPDKKVEGFIEKEEPYLVGNKKRKLIFMKRA